MGGGFHSSYVFRTPDEADCGSRPEPQLAASRFLGSPSPLEPSHKAICFRVKEQSSVPITVA